MVGSSSSLRGRFTEEGGGLEGVIAVLLFWGSFETFSVLSGRDSDWDGDEEGDEDDVTEGSRRDGISTLR